MKNNLTLLLLFTVALIISCSGQEKPKDSQPEPDADITIDPVQKLTIEKLDLLWNTNGYLVMTEDEAMVIDPGSEADIIAKQAADRKITHAVLTHGHFDHITALNDLVALYPDIKVMVHSKDRSMLYDHTLNLSSHFIDTEWKFTGTISRELEHGDTFSFNGNIFKVVHTPGHTDGSCAIYLEKENILWSGDTLMKGKIGFIPELGMDKDQIVTSIETRLFTLPENTRVLPGHGPETTIGEEKENLPQN